MLYKAEGFAFSRCREYIKDFDTPKSKSSQTTEFTVNRYTYCPRSSGPKKRARYQFATKEASMVMACEPVVKAILRFKFISLIKAKPEPSAQSQHDEHYASDLQCAELLSQKEVSQ